MHFYAHYQQNFNADYQLTAKQGADTLAFQALIEQKLKPALVCMYPFAFTLLLWAPCGKRVK